jgi:DNA phosphorothioation system restriction enzyme
MGFNKLDIKISYRSENEDEIIHDFYIPVLSQAVSYKRAVGFFSSSILIQISKGISKLIENGGTIKIVASPELTEDDIEAIVTGYEMRETVMERALMRKLYEPVDKKQEERFNYIAHLIANRQLDIKIALMDGGKTNGMYHEKIGIVEDQYGDKIAFTGSLNETDNAVQRNFESIDVYTSWGGDTDLERIKNKEKDFNNLWEDKTRRLTIFEFPKAVEEKILKYRRNNIKKEEELIENDMMYLHEEKSNYSYTPKYPSSPAWFRIREYQEEAIRAWQENDYKGLFNMATGTGKTLTALSAVTTLWKVLKDKLAVIIVCPYTHLVEQWREDVLEFNMDPIIAYSSSSQKNWQKTLENKIHRYNLGIIKNICVLTTNATYKTDKFQKLVKEIDENVLFIVDEAHNAGAEEFSSYLNERFKFRLALSATPKRHLDDFGTDRILNYFDKEVYYFGLERAIKEGFLTNYYYYPEIVYLTDEEYIKYLEISKKLSKFIVKQGKQIKLTETAKSLLIKRARLVAGAINKLDRLRELMSNKTHSNYNLVYCGATYVEGETDEEEVRQIEAVTNILGNEFNMRIARFTAAESPIEREQIIKDFSTGEDLQAIVAIKCLDEGVNIPSIQNAYILASSTNPREFIQRRGRVLRKFKGKSFAYIYDFLTLPRELNTVSLVDNDQLRFDMSLIKKELIRAKEFASLAENKNAALEVLEEIEEVYGRYMSEEEELVWQKEE